MRVENTSKSLLKLKGVSIYVQNMNTSFDSHGWLSLRGPALK